MGLKSVVSIKLSLLLHRHDYFYSKRLCISHALTIYDLLALFLFECVCAGKNHDLLADNKDLGNVGTGYYDKTVLEDRYISQKANNVNTFICVSCM